jgi:queuine/archaeosine tRNA-ribosyltransferase
MKMFQIQHRDGAARVAKLSFPTSGLTLKTPAFLIRTVRGGVLNLTVDIIKQLQKLDDVALQLDVMH